ncbi:hypothetical protein OEA41_009746 [Lepraria neglecta]|uniref:Uncharacterized protein n=1 Tax=Lepraria neglecta TaxID=209136 RepID=A0AAD9Z2J8_9LECA|nr:hypothetical protein OEA41_009746 [Lepraria neglecta]
MSKTPEVFKLTRLPLIVTPRPPAEIVVQSIEKAVGLGVKTSPPTVYTLLDDRRMMLLPMSRVSEVSNLTILPSMVTPGPPANMVVPSIEKDFGLGLKTSFPTVKTVGEAGLAESNIVLLPMSKIPDIPKLTTVPSIVTPGPPAEMGVPSIENAVGFGVKT